MPEHTERTTRHAATTPPRFVMASDVGGTFTDTILVDLDTGRTWSAKVASRRRQQEEAVAEGIAAVVRRARTELGDDALGGSCVLHHGSTVATNALLERRVAPTALVTNAGFEDLTAIRRQDRPALYDLHVTRAEPLVPDALRFGVPVRRDAQGRNHGADAGAVAARVDDIVAALGAADVAAVAVGFLHADLYPEDERAVATRLRESLPGVAVCASHEVWPEPREVERFETTLVNAALVPVMGAYLDRLSARVAAAGAKLGLPVAGVRVMDSAGALSDAAAAARVPASLLLSGPAGGVAAATGLGAALGLDAVVTFDVGGTSTDVALAVGGRGRLTHSTRVGGFAAGFPAVEVHTLGAGGGSVLWRDAGGHLQVGPASQGARPGPACYGNGGDVPTLTDALLLAGRLPPGLVLGGRTRPDRQAAYRVMERLAGALRRPLEETVLGALRVAVAATAGAVHVVTTHRGHDPRQAALVAFGGAGPMIAADLASALGVSRVVVPFDAGTFSARGMVAAPVVDRGAVGVALVWRAPVDAPGFVSGLRDALERADPGGGGALQGRVALRYAGQSYELEVPFAAGDPADAVVDAFHAAHERAYGHRHVDRPVEAVRVVAERTTAVPDPGWAAGGDGGARPRTLVEECPVWLAAEAGCVERTARVVWRGELGPGQSLPGPLVVPDETATTFVPPGWSVRVDPVTRALLLSPEVAAGG